MYLLYTPDNTTPTPVLSCANTPSLLNRRLVLCEKNFTHPLIANMDMPMNSSMQEGLWLHLIALPCLTLFDSVLSVSFFLTIFDSMLYFHRRLDVFFTKLSEDILCFDGGPPRGNSNHLTLCFDYVCFSCPNPSENRKRNMWKGDSEGMKRHLYHQNWETMLVGYIETKWFGFKTVLLKKSLSKNSAFFRWKRPLANRRYPVPGGQNICCKN